MIGLVDFDFQSQTKLNPDPPNIEIMKLANYYRTEENKFSMLVDLNADNFEGFEKIYFFSEKNNPPKIPPQFLKQNDIIYGGTAFTNGNYSPFKNILIDFTLPSPHIYRALLQDKYNNGVKFNNIAHILDDSYQRLYAGNEQLPITPVKSRKRIWIYDRDIFYKDGLKILKHLATRQPSSIKMIHPIICKTMHNYKEIRAIEKISRDNKIILDLPIPLNEVHYLLKQYSNYLLADITKTSNVFLPLGCNYDTSFQYYKDYIYKLNLLYSFWSKGIPIKLLYIPPKIGYNDSITELSQVTATWSQTIPNEKTINDRIIFKTYLKHPKGAHAARDILLKFYPKANDLFNQSFNEISKRRMWKI